MILLALPFSALELAVSFIVHLVPGSTLMIKGPSKLYSLGHVDRDANWKVNIQGCHLSILMKSGQADSL